MTRANWPGGTVFGEQSTTALSDRLYYATWSDSSKANPVNLLAKFCEAERATCLRQPKVATEENPECKKEER